MPPKKKLSKKEKARLEAEQAELLRIEMEKEKQKKLEEARQRKQLELEQCKRRKQLEIEEYKKRRAQLKNSMLFFDTVQSTIDGIQGARKSHSNWEKFMRCNGLPNANSPSDLRKYMHQWRSDNEARSKNSRNWLLRTDERTILTQDANVPDLTQATLRKQQGNLGDLYAQRVREVLGILKELHEAIADKAKAPHTVEDLQRLKIEIRVFLKEYLDEFTYKIMSHIERDMEIERAGVCKHTYNSDVFQTHFWTYAKDAQVSLNPQKRINVGDQAEPIEIDFPFIDMQIALPPTVQLQSSALRGLWLNFDHYSDYCQSYYLKRPRPERINMIAQNRSEWRKRKEIMQVMLDECTRESPRSEQDGSVSSQKPRQRTFDVEKKCSEYEDNLCKARKRAIGPEAYGMLETDVNLRKYRIIGGVYCIDYMEIPEQDKKLNARSFIRTIHSPNKLCQKTFYHTYKPPPPVQPGVRRLPEEIEAEMRMIEAALDKLALVTVQLPDSVIWFEPPIACRWETSVDTLQSDLTEGVKKTPLPATPADITPLSTATTSPLKGSPRFTSKMRKRSSQKLSEALPVHELNDFDMFNIPCGIDIYGLLKDYVVPRMPQGFAVRLECADANKAGRRQKRKPKVLFLARHEDAARVPPLRQPIAADERTCRYQRINKDFLDLDEPRAFFPDMNLKKVLKFSEYTTRTAPTVTATVPSNQQKQFNGDGNGNGNGNGHGNPNGNGNGNGQCNPNGNGNGCDNGSAQKIKDSGQRRGTADGTPTGSIASSESTENSLQSGERSDPGSGQNTYMFSQLLEDLDRLYELQMPVQEEALRQISASLKRSASATTHDDDCDNGSAGSKVANLQEPKRNSQDAAQRDTNTAQPLFNSSLYTAISFVRNWEGSAGRLADDDKAHGSGEDADAEADVNDDSSSSACDEYDYDDEYLYDIDEDGHAGDTASSNMPATPSGFAAAGGLRDFLSKHNQSESDSHADGSKPDGRAALNHGKWSTRDIHDTKFNEDKLSIQFRTGRLGIFGFALNRYSNMPYQAWEIKPDFRSPGSILLNFTASIVSLDMTITSAGYCMNNFQGGSSEAINNMIGQVYPLAELQERLTAAAVDIFPDEDAFCYTEGSCEKNYIMEMHLYACMSTLALSHNFSWSRWNLLAGSRSAVLLLRELIEGKKVPNHSTLLVTPVKTAIIECTEVSASFNSAGIVGMDYFADLYQLAQVHAQPASLAKQRTMDPVLRENVARILMAIRPDGAKKAFNIAAPF